MCSYEEEGIFLVLIGPEEGELRPNKTGFRAIARVLEVSTRRKTIL